ncbi:ABC transporter substrate-binding protein [Catellatospora sp. IY07-71]|uniref:sugar ABC transporter substrate-binding protein n=1 Tax=Catellatospora sp. IY07-71 TaxID=2728827 RepID=UPI001BB3C962|nr:sugar ABC transporter substrate-binding protein [Catellatospora sp. IY07-71]BCJ78152.1 ABC transporter substrate-binding protein [Catellatospora sp. IY07-71]
MISRRLAVAVSAVLLVAFGVAACESGGSQSGSGSGGKIALLLPESQTTRYEQHDRPLFEAKVKELCADCEVIYSNAQQDQSRQQQQAEAALNNGAQVLVLDPVDGAAAATIVSLAKSKNVPVISYDRLIQNAPVDYYISFDNERVGQLQGESLVSRLKELGKTAGNVVMINGSPTDNNAKQFNKGAHSVLDTSGFKTVPTPDFFTPEWKPENAQRFMEGQISQLGKDGFVGVYAANDGTAGGAISAMRAAGMSPVPPTTGQDAELAAIQRIVNGDQYMTVYKAFQPEADKAAELAVALVKGEKPTTDRTVDNGAVDVPSFLLEPQAVNKQNIKDTVVADKLYTVEQICTQTYAAACQAAGLT